MSGESLKVSFLISFSLYLYILPIATISLSLVLSGGEIAVASKAILYGLSILPYLSTCSPASAITLYTAPTTAPGLPKLLA